MKGRYFCGYVAPIINDAVCILPALVSCTGLKYFLRLLSRYYEYNFVYFFLYLRYVYEVEEVPLLADLTQGTKSAKKGEEWENRA